MTSLTKGRLEAIIEAIGQTLACASELDTSREELETARDWAIEELAKRINRSRYRDNRPAWAKTVESRDAAP